VSTYVLIPGAGGDSYYWHLVAPLLEAGGHEVIAPDIPAGDDSAGLREYADAVLEAIDDRGDLVVVAQSIGALAAPLLCERADVRLLILVAPMIGAPGETGAECWSEHEGASEIDVKTTLLHDVPEEVIADLFARGEPRQSTRPFGETWPLDAWPDVPTRVLACRNDRLFPFEATRRLTRERIGVEADAIDTGHTPALAQPEELAERLLAYAAE
jgi:pimeloyl-ACP methyl ester carboxylesterase